MKPQIAANQIEGENKIYQLQNYAKNTTTKKGKWINDIMA